MGATVLYCILWAGGIVFLAGSVVRAIRYSRQPLHLRWEIYPVPQGTSGQIKAMVPEILFLKGLWEFNRPMWYVSFPFHFGLYLLAASVAAFGCSKVAPGVLFPVLHRISVGCGILGAVSAWGGALGLLTRRLAVRELRQYSSAGDFFNLLFFIVTLALLMVGRFWKLPSVFATGMACGALLLAYIPMTHMSHFIAKYFTYHQVRWDESANVRGGRIEKRMAEYLMYRPTWAANHIAAGSRTWAEIATSNPAPAKGAAK